MESLIGLIMFYAWGHSLVLIFTRVKLETPYEKAVMIAGLVGIVLFVMGSLSGM